MHFKSGSSIKATEWHDFDLSDANLKYVEDILIPSEVVESSQTYTIDNINFMVYGYDYTAFDILITEIKLEPGNVATDWSPNVADIIKSSINVSPESIQIASNNISLAGKTIALTTDNIEINSTNFSVTNSGNITAKSGTIGGINMIAEGLYSNGSLNTQGFGLWKNDFHQTGDDSIIFHAGADQTRISDAKLKIYANGHIDNTAGITCYGQGTGTTHIISISNETDKGTQYETTRRSYMAPGVIETRYDNHSVLLFPNAIDFDSSVNSEVQADIGVFKKVYMQSGNYIIRPDTATNQINLQSGSGTAILNLQGTAYVSIEASAFVVSSSKRYKENIKDLKNGDLIMKLRPVVFDYKENSKMNGQNVAGLIAEEVEKLDKNLVSYKTIDGKEQPSGIDYSKIIPYLVKKVQEQQKEIEELKEQIKGVINGK